MSVILRTLPWILAANLVSACYVHTAAEINAVSPGNKVRVVLTPAGVERLREGSARIMDEVEGSLVSVSPDSLIIERRIGEEFRGTAFEDVRQRLTVARAEVREIRTPVFHMERTLLVSAGIAVVTGVVLAELFSLDAEGSGGANRSPNPPRPSVVSR